MLLHPDSIGIYCKNDQSHLEPDARDGTKRAFGQPPDSVACDTEYEKAEDALFVLAKVEIPESASCEIENGGNARISVDQAVVPIVDFSRCKIGVDAGKRIQQ